MALACGGRRRRRGALGQVQELLALLLGLGLDKAHLGHDDALGHAVVLDILMATKCSISGS